MERESELKRLTRPIIGIENRTAQEVFDIMADRIRLDRPSPDESEKPVACSVAVKALEWRRELGDTCFARTPVGTYSCPRFHSEWDLLKDGRHMHPKIAGVIKAYPTLEAAQAAAWADYEPLIRSALAPRPSVSPDIEGLVERLKQAKEGDHKRGCQGREYDCSCGYDEALTLAALEAADALTLLAGERCPIGLDRTPSICSAGSCDKCQASHAKHYMEKAIAQRDLLSGEVERLTKLLEPFAKVAGPINGEEGRPTYLDCIIGKDGTDELALTCPVGTTDSVPLWADDFRAAFEALNPSSQGAGG